MNRLKDGRNGDLDWINATALDQTVPPEEDRESYIAYGIFKAGVFFWPRQAVLDISAYPSEEDRIDSVMVNGKKYDGKADLIESIYVMPEEDIVPALTAALLAGDLEVER